MSTPHRASHLACEPTTWPTSLDNRWTCPECGAEHRAFDIHTEFAGVEMHAALLRKVPKGTLGWTTNPTPTTDPSSRRNA